MDISTLRDMMKQAHLPEKAVSLCLRGDLQADFDRLERELQAVREKPRDSLADDGGHSLSLPIVKQMEALQAEMRTGSVEVLLRALPRAEWKALIADHPPRQDDEGDRNLQFNRATFYDAMVLACWAAPEELSVEERQKLLNMLTSAQFDKLATTAWGLNRHDVDVPFSQAASRIARSSGGTPKRQPGSASASDAGTAGSRRKSRSTTMTKKAG